MQNEINKEIGTARPQSLTAAAGDYTGEIDLLWEPVNGAKNYIIQKSIGTKIPSKWVQEDIIAKSSYTLTKLKSNKSYWFRVAAVDSRGQGPWSKPVQKKAP